MNEIHFIDERNWRNSIYSELQEHTFMDIDRIVIHSEAIILIDSQCGERHAVVKDRNHAVYLEYNGSRLILTPDTGISVIEKNMKITGSTKVMMVVGQEGVTLKIVPYQFEDIDIKIESCRSDEK